MRNNFEISPVLAAILTNMLDRETDVVRVISPEFSGLTNAFYNEHFMGHFDGTDNDVAISTSDNCNVLVGIETNIGHRVGENINAISKYISSNEQKQVLIVSNNLLFSNRIYEKKFRKDILEKNLLAASIQLPERLISGLSCGFSIIIIDKDRNEDNRMVNFIDAKTIDTKKISEMIENNNKKELHEYIKKEFDYLAHNQFSKHSLDLCVRNSSLLASYHCLTERQNKAKETLEYLETQKLGKIANFFRPLLPNKEGEVIKVLNVSDLSNYGYTSAESYAEIKTARTGKTDPLLRAGDVILTVRGALGKVGIVSSDFSTDIPWTVSPSAIILRPTRKEYDARLLYLYLRSELGQESIKKLACGATVPMVQVADLKDMDIAIPSAEEAEQILADFEAEVSLCENIDELNKQRNELACRHWRIQE